jgi:PAS domain S-box-containing protein
VPITTGERVLGALGLFNLETPFAQSDEILATLESIGWQTGVALENASLFQQVNEYAHTLQEKVEERTAEIQKQKEQTDAILESAADAIFITAADGLIEYVNPAFSVLTGYTPEQVINRSFEILISGQTSTKKYQRMWNTILAGRTWRGDVKCKRFDDSLYDADLTVAPIFNVHGRIDKFVAIQRDISKKTELDRLKSEFLVTASHELRTPLTNVIGYTELLLNRSFSTEESQNFLRYIYDQSKYLATLVSDLLDVSKMETGAAVVVSPKLINPGHIFREIIDYWQGAAANHDISLVQPKMWPDIKADPDRLKQVLNNLLSNSVKYSPNGDKITTSVRLNPGNIHVSIKDQGIGMSIDELKHLFEKFWRADASAVAVEGTGLGMVIVKHIIEAHGGKIWVSSRKGAGTRVNFTLPLMDSAPTILVVEDDPSIVEILERLLRMEEYHVLTAQTGTIGLKMAISEHPDLIILDLMLPELEGEDLLRRLKDTPATAAIPVVVVSAKSALTNIEYVFTLGAADFLTKPFDFDELLSRIRIALLSKGN